MLSLKNFGIAIAPPCQKNRINRQRLKGCLLLVGLLLVLETRGMAA